MLKISNKISNFRKLLKVSLFFYDKFPALNCTMDVTNNERKNNYDIVYNQVYCTFHNILEIISVICNSSFPSFSFLNEFVIYERFRETFTFVLFIIIFIIDLLIHFKFNYFNCSDVQKFY